MHTAKEEDELLRQFLESESPRMPIVVVSPPPEEEEEWIKDADEVVGSTQGGDVAQSWTEWWVQTVWAGAVEKTKSVVPAEEEKKEEAEAYVSSSTMKKLPLLMPTWKMVWFYPSSMEESLFQRHTVEFKEEAGGTFSYHTTRSE